MRRVTDTVRAHPPRTLLGVAALVATALAVPVDLVLAPPDRLQGDAQRLMYVHVPSVWTAYLAFAVVLLASLGVLAAHDPRWDTVAVAAAELGAGMTALTLAEGALWGSRSWGTWWTWDPRLVSTALLLVLYVAYLLVHSLPGPADRVQRRAAVLGIVAFAQVVVVHFSVLWWRSLHQPPTLLGPDQPAPIAGSMLSALLVSLVASTLAGAWFVASRCEQLRAAGAAESAAPAPRPATASRGDEVVAGRRG